MSPRFLTIEQVLKMHQRQVRRFGGSHGLRDRGLLESALAQPQATFCGEYLHADLFEMAAAYLFHLASNHPFVDGNKRIALVAAVVFLRDNGVSISGGNAAMYEITLATAKGEIAKEEIATRFRKLARVSP